MTIPLIDGPGLFCLFLIIYPGIRYGGRTTRIYFSLSKSIYIQNVGDERVGERTAVEGWIEVGDRTKEDDKARFRCSVRIEDEGGGMLVLIKGLSIYRKGREEYKVRVFISTREAWRYWV